MPDDIAVIGAGGFGRETLDVIEAINAAAPAPVWHVIGVFDDDPAKAQQNRLADRQVPLLGPVQAFSRVVATCRYIVGIGSPGSRARISSMIDQWGASAATLVHPAAVIGSRGSIAPGSIICGGAQISTNVEVGRHVHINPGAIVGHDAVLEDFVSINPGAIVSGEVLIGSETLLGAGCVVLQNLVVGRGSIVGASACVTRSIPQGSTARGVPARWGRDDV